MRPTTFVGYFWDYVLSCSIKCCFFLFCCHWPGCHVFREKEKSMRFPRRGKIFCLRASEYGHYNVPTWITRAHRLHSTHVLCCVAKGFHRKQIIICWYIFTNSKHTIFACFLYNQQEWMLSQLLIIFRNNVIVNPPLCRFKSTLCKLLSTPCKR